MDRREALLEQWLEETLPVGTQGGRILDLPSKSRSHPSDEKTFRCEEQEWTETEEELGFGPGDLRREKDGHMQAGTGPDQRACAMLLGESLAAQRVRQQIARVARLNISVLLRGETGTGKDVTARMIHAQSGRSLQGDYCKINCPAVPENLFESEMFGYERGSFTGAERRRIGRFEQAHEGTLFLDEIGLLSPGMQAKLLDVLESQSFYRIGGTQRVRVDTRIISATNAPLEAMIENDTFRADLFYRIGVYTIFLPPLRHHTEDIPLLFDHFVALYSRRFLQPRPPAPRELLAGLMHYPWPGNVRELESVAARYVVEGDPRILQEVARTRSDGAPPEAAGVLEDQEVRTIKATLIQTGWNQHHAAQLLGISDSAPRRRIQKHRLHRPH